MDRINWVTGDCFRAVHQLERAPAERDVDAGSLYGSLREYVEQALARAAEAGYPEREARQIGYALAAFADETAMRHEGPLRAHWSTRPLQLALFADNVAGERFFDELERARSAESLDVVRVYALCITFGFRGRYGVQGGEGALQELHESVRNQLARGLPMPELLAPDGPRPSGGLVALTRGWPLTWVALAAGAASLVLYLGCLLALREQLAELSLLASRGAP